jgi:anti-anti-sigma factor
VEFHPDDTDSDLLIFNADSGIDSYSDSPVLDELLHTIEGGPRGLIVDCSALGYISSVGLTTLMRLHKRMSERGGHVKLVNVSAPLARLLSITRLNQVLVAYPSVDAAREAFRSEPGGTPVK